jgi:hypothetical protein
MTNLKFGSLSNRLNTVEVVASHPATPAAGDPIRLNDKIMVAAIDEASGLVTAVISGIFELSVCAKDASGSGGADANSAVVHGDKLYYSDADTPVLSKRADGTFAGYAHSTTSGTLTGTLITAGATATIRVWIP